MAVASHPARLPLWRSVRDAYLLTFRHLGAFLRIAWAWLLAMTALIAFLSWFLWPLQETAMASSSSSRAHYAASVVALIGGSSIAVAWHRLLLMAELPAAAAYLRLDKVVWRYLLVALVMAAPFYFAIETIDGAFGAQDEGASLGARLAVASIWLLPLSVLYLGIRLAPFLPAIALGRGDVTLARVWRATARNWWRLLIGLLLTGLLPSLLIYAPFLVREVVSDFPAAASATDFVRANLETELCGLVGGMFAVTFLSLAYRHFLAAGTDGPAAR